MLGPTKVPNRALNAAHAHFPALSRIQTVWIVGFELETNSRLIPSKVPCLLLVHIKDMLGPKKVPSRVLDAKLYCKIALCADKNVAVPSGP